MKILYSAKKTRRNAAGGRAVCGPVKPVERKNSVIRHVFFVQCEGEEK